MQFMSPIFLLGLIGLTLPIFIHLWSKKTKRTVGFGSTRFLKETETRTLRSLHPSQLLLLLLRMGILTCLVLILASPVITSKVKPRQQVVVIDPEYKDADWLGNIVDTAEYAVWLSHGFPSIKDSSEIVPVRNYWESLKSLEELNANELVVFSPRPIDGFVGSRYAIPAVAAWYSPSSPAQEKQINISKGDQNWEVKITTNERVSRVNVSPASSTGRKLRIGYHVHATRLYEKQGELFELMMETLQESNPIIEFSAVSQEEATLLVWLSPETPPVAPFNFWIKDDQELLVVYQGAGLFTINPDLMNAKNLVRSHFLLQLEQVLYDHVNIEYGDQRQMPLHQLTSSDRTSANASTIQKSATGNFWILLVVIFCMERVIAIRKK